MVPVVKVGARPSQIKIGSDFIIQQIGDGMNITEARDKMVFVGPDASAFLCDIASY